MGQATAGQGVSWDDLGHLSGVFPFKHLKASEEQGPPKWLLTQLHQFVAAVSTQAPVAALWPGLSPSQLSHLQATLHLMHDPGPGLHVEWLQDFGCALLPLLPTSAAALQPDHVALYLMVPDAWTFATHSYPDAMQFASGSSKASCLYVGSVATAQYSSLTCTMHTIIKQQQQLKAADKQTPGGQRRSHFQRTPAFIESVIAAALSLLSEDPETGSSADDGGSRGVLQQRSDAVISITPPRGGFTDVGRHTGSCPKATSWPVLQSVLQVLLQLRVPSSMTDDPPTCPELQQLFDQTLLQFELWLMQQLLLQLTPATAGLAAVTACLTMLQSVTVKAAELAVAGVNVAAVEAACAAARQQIDAAVAQRQLHAAAEYALPTDAAAAAGSWRLPSGVLPAKQPAKQQQQGLAGAKYRAEANLHSVEIVATSPDSSSLLQQLGRLKALLSTVSTANAAAGGSQGGGVEAQHSLRSFERLLFLRAAGIFKEPALTAEEVAVLASTVDTYRVALSTFRETLASFRDSSQLSHGGGKDGAASMPVDSTAAAAAVASLAAELRSREVLVGWAAFCLTHQAAAAEHPLVLQYGVAVDWQDLRHLSLTTKSATVAALGVCSYLKQHSRPGRELFHLSKQTASLSFAETFAAGDGPMQAMLQVHAAAAAARMDQHWQKVQAQQQLAASLSREITQLKDDVHTQRLSLPSYLDSSYSSKLAEVDALNSKISRKIFELAAAEKPPPPVIQPLPRQEHLARQWLFFLHMPDLLRHLARSSCLAQQLLLPRPLPTHSVWPGRVAGLTTRLHDFYNSKQAEHRYHTPCKEYRGFDGGPGHVLSMSTSAPPGTVGPAHIDGFSSREDGVWFPDGMTLTMAWAGSGCTVDSSSAGYFNPFKPVSNHLTVESFAAQLPRSYSSLQWSLYQYGSLDGTATDRGNQGLARQGEKPADLSKSAYLAATALRSFPARQLHRLCDCLRERELPLEHPAVQLLVEQTVYHVGQLTGNDSSSASVAAAIAAAAARVGVGAAAAGAVPHQVIEILSDTESESESESESEFESESDTDSSGSSGSHYQVSQLWRTGWSETGGVLAALCFELTQLASELANKPRDQGSVLLLGQLAAYLSGWHPSFTPIARHFAAMTSSYADQQLQQQIDVLVSQGADEAALAELKAKQTRWRAMALLCFADGPMYSDDAGTMLRLMLLIKHGDVYQPDRPAAAELSALRVRCHDVMARRLSGIVRAVCRQPQLLTDSAASILECLQQQPDGTPPPKLSWKQLSRSGDSGSGSGSVKVASFAAVGSDGHLYSINVLDGTLLFDGNPPGRLPNSILQHSLYLRTFGTTNHEVKTTADGQLETIRPIEGRFYRFSLVQPTPQDQGQLVVTEIDLTQQGMGRLELQLLDPGADDACGDWGNELPLRLRQMHSHWYDREHGAIVLRPKDFQKHAQQFLIRCNVAASLVSSSPSSSTGTAVSAVYSCWPVPLHLQQCHWTTGLTQHAEELSQRQLVLPITNRSPVLKVFSKFELPEFIHMFTPGLCPGLMSAAAGSAQRASAHSSSTLRSTRSATAASSAAPLLPTSGTGSAGMVWQLPRCSLDFELTAEGRVMSLDHRGYCLSTQQLLVPQSAQRAIYTLPEVHQYLVLHYQPGNTGKYVSADQSDQLVLVPAGRVLMQRHAPGSMHAGSSIEVQLEPHCFASVQVFKYSVHGRFGYLTASCTTSCSQLAALYAASSTLLPEPLSQLTGAATAMQLVRHSWTNEPLSTMQQQHLQDISALGGFLAPGLKLLCHDLAASSSQLQHLHVPETGTGAAARHASTEPLSAQDSTLTAAGGSKPVLDTDAVTEYIMHVRSQGPAGFPTSPRLQLSSEEEAWLLHTGPLSLSGSARCTPLWKRSGAYAEISALPGLPVGGEYVQRAEAALAALVEQPARRKQVPAFPLPPLLDSSVPVAQRMMDELEDSWDCYQQHPAPEKLIPGALEKLRTGPYTLAAVTGHRTAAESYLLHHLAWVEPDTRGAPGRAFRLLVGSCVHPSPSATDLLRLAWGPESGFRSFNPFLSNKACGQLREGVLVWLQLCVLEDRLQRVMNLAAAGDEYMPLLIKELLTRRTWDVSRHAQWLVFEVEGRLQIRPAQHTLARTLLEGSGPDGLAPIAQLNMGEGKTRVILPMMVLELADNKHLVRGMFLSQLLHEGRSHLQQHLTASVLGRKVFVMPFHRGIQVTPQALSAMKASLAYCQKAGGVLLMAPEHKNSLYLKHLEMSLAAESTSQQSCAAQVLDLLNNFPYFDILDESDEVLHHHRRQLVYAWGECIPLPALEARIEVVQSLLLLLSKLTDAGMPELKRDCIALKTGPPADRKPGSFCGLQLLPGDQLDASVDTILHRLATALVTDPPMEDELGWMKGFQDEGRLLVELMTDRSKDASDRIAKNGALSALPDDKQHQLLAARGLLACGLLVHCLQSRHRVNHGVNRASSAKKRLAVPFRAADVPASRSEFSQADVAMVYTHLSYYFDGLSKAEFRQAVSMLLGRGPSEQAYHFNRWLAQGRACGSPNTGGCTSIFDAVDKVDPHNTQLMDAMWAYFSHNMEVVNFWLASCVLPTETKQYPSRLTATAWHLAERASNGRGLVGFSGTNDNHWLLPSQVQQVQLYDAPDLQGTNGKMLDMLLRHARYDTLVLPRDDTQAATPVWQLLLQQALVHGVDAVIDAGALLAGVNLRSAAEYIIANMPAGRYRGVTYFCPAAGCWVILDDVGRLSPKASSHLAEAETLALFDDARCRGADLKLRQCAVGLLTLSAGMPKDKLMQAAGRLRQLGRGQTLLLMGLPDISSKTAAAWGRLSSVKQAAPVRPAAQTAPAPAPAPAPARVRHAKRTAPAPALERPAKRAAPALAPAPGPLNMCAVLSWVMANTVEATLSGIAEAAHQGIQFAATYGGDPQGCVLPERLSVAELYGGCKVKEPMPQLLQAVAEHYTAHAAVHGAPAASCGNFTNTNDSVTRSSSSSICIAAAAAPCMASSSEVQVPAATAAEEVSWNWRSALTANSARKLQQAGCQMVQLPQGVQEVGAGGCVGDIAWCSKVWVSHNFLNSISGSPASPGLRDFLRPVGALLVFRTSREVLLLSEREADAVQTEVWATSAAAGTSKLHAAAGSLPNLLLSLPYLRLACAQANTDDRGRAAAAAAEPAGPDTVQQQLFLATALAAPTGSRGGVAATPWPDQLASLVPVELLVSVQLFAGAVMYGSTSQHQLLHGLMSGRREAAQELLAWRGRPHLLARSDLDRACSQQQR